MRRTLLVAAFALCSLTLLIPTNTNAADYFLTVGGGYSPTGNQASLERNVVFIRQILAESYPEGVRHDVYFADGNDPGRDLQIYDAEGERPRVNDLVSQVFRQRREFGYEYRSHELGEVQGPSTRSTLEQWFDNEAGSLTADDRLFIYFTGHGGSSNDKENHPSNTCFYMWNTERMRMQEFVTQLDRIPDEVPVVLVMVQCFAGGFTDVIFNGGDSEQGTAAANRCGFYATVRNRVAAGCTPSIDEANYQEYSSYFWAAIRGANRVGELIERPDYNGDGQVSFDEAHAYSLITSTTIDISVKTSDAFLRALSTTENGDHPDLYTADTQYAELIKEASSCDQAVIEALSAALGIDAPQRATAARELASQIDEEKKEIENQLKGKKNELNEVCKKIRQDLVARWPELTNAWNPQVPEIFATEGDAIVELIESHERYADMQRLLEEVEALGDQKADAVCRWVRCQRLIRALENVALAANLPVVAEPSVVERYRQLLAAEAGTFGPQVGATEAVSVE